MNHQEFMACLCKIFHDWAVKKVGEDPPCFCGDKSNPIPGMEIKNDTWRCSPSFLRELADTLNVEFPKQEG
jgi:hypothetical protein